MFAPPSHDEAHGRTNPKSFPPPRLPVTRIPVHSPYRFNGFEPRRQEVIQGERDEISRTTDAEQDRIARLDVSGGLEAIQQLARVDGEQDAAERASRAAD